MTESKPGAKRRTIEAAPGSKLSVVIRPDWGWEYRCGGCGQLRYRACNEKPRTCWMCGSDELTVGKPGTLPTDEQLAAPADS